MKKANSILALSLVYLPAALIAVGLKYHYSRASADELFWILSPTAALTEALDGLTFIEESGTGFVNYKHRVIIAPACAGINFMITAFCTAVLGFLHRLSTSRRQLVFTAASLAGAYGLTILVNAFRILISIELYQADIYGKWLTPATVHRILGIVIYLAALYGFYRTAAFVSRRFGADQSLWKLNDLLPFVCYLAMTIGVPLLNGVLHKNPADFKVHCQTVLVVGLIMLMTAGWSRFYMDRRISGKRQRKKNSRSHQKNYGSSPNELEIQVKC